MKISPKFNPTTNCVLFEGDCLNLLKQIADKFVKLVVTSPPYNLGKEYETRRDLKNYLELQKKIIEESVRILDNSGSICWQVGNYVDNGKIIPLDIVLYPIFRGARITTKKPYRLALWSRTSCFKKVFRKV